MIITGYMGDSCVLAQNEKGQEYMYTGVLPKTKKKIDSHIARGRFGKAWNLLKQHTCMKKGSDE